MVMTMVTVMIMVMDIVMVMVMALNKYNSMEFIVTSEITGSCLIHGQ